VLDPGADEAILRRQKGPLTRGARPRRVPITEPSDLIASNFTCAVRPEWIDNNGHMNMGYYVVVFDLATDEWMRHIGLDAAHRQAREVTTFCLEAHVTYHREVREGDPLRFTTRLLAHDAKRMHYIHEMFHADAGYLAATNELMSLHVSQKTRRGAPMAAEILERLAQIQAAHDRLPRPPQVGRVMGLEARPTTR
jgi:acyl-CoA thioester hydrolase